MANPRYAPQQRDNPRDSKLATALQFANLGLQQQEVSDRSQAARVAQAIQLLGLQQQQAQDQARNQQAADMLGYDKQKQASQEKFQQDSLTSAQSHQADQSGQFWSGTLPMEYARSQAIEGHQTAIEQQGQDAIKMQLVEHMLSDPRIPLDQALSFAPASLASNIAQMKSTALQGRVGQATQAVAPIYQANATHPNKIAEALKLIAPTYAAQPEVWNGIPWDQLNQGLPGTGSSGSSSATPPTPLAALYQQAQTSRVANQPDLSTPTPHEEPGSDAWLARQWARLKQLHYNLTQPVLLDPRENRAYQTTQYNNP